MYRMLSYADRLSSVRAPTLVLVGTHDPEAPPPCSEELAAGIPDARLITFERSGHFPFVEEPARFKDTVEAFFDPRAFGPQTGSAGHLGAVACCVSTGH
jgi:pimeloyl-ACP methyl ester carboxylesterase